MGVLGITPFLQKTCPHVFSKLPDRLGSLRGKTVVIDATLVTQRLHFAPTPHAHRHIIGWHRIISELRESDVRAICVFDGKQRSAAKAREAERRRESRKIDAARGSIETTRLHRLQKLIRLLPFYRSLASADRQHINGTLSNIRSTCRSLDAHVSGSTLFAPPSFRTVPTSTWVRIISHSDRAFPPSRYSYFFPPGDTGIQLHDLHDVLDSAVIAPPLSSRSEPHCMPPPHCVDNSSLAITDDQLGSCNTFYDPHEVLSTLPLAYWNSAVQSIPTASNPPPDSIESLEPELSALFSEYSQCVTQLTTIPSSSPEPEISELAHVDDASADSPDTFDARLEHAMSKQQLQMTLDEGHIWTLLSRPSFDGPPLETESALMVLAERSTVISQSYQRRSTSATSQTYEECKELLRAMGVPCIESSGPFEAEALACALVIHGYADYVASEDTDVLVYETPMLRGITTRESPIVVIHGDTIRETLRLDRARYVDFALLLGTDFSQRIKNVGPNRALKFIKEHGSIERIVQEESKYPPRVPAADYLAQVGLARLVFQNLPPLPDIGLFHQGEVDSNAMSDIIQRYKLQRMLPNAWDAQSALAGNYFGDDPSV